MGSGLPSVPCVVHTGRAKLSEFVVCRHVRFPICEIGMATDHSGSTEPGLLVSTWQHSDRGCVLVMARHSIVCQDGGGSQRAVGPEDKAPSERGGRVDLPEGRLLSEKGPCSEEPRGSGMWGSPRSGRRVTQTTPPPSSSAWPFAHHAPWVLMVSGPPSCPPGACLRENQGYAHHALPLSIHSKASTCPCVGSAWHRGVRSVSQCPG